MRTETSSPRWVRFLPFPRGSRRPAIAAAAAFAAGFAAVSAAAQAVPPGAPPATVPARPAPPASGSNATPPVSAPPAAPGGAAAGGAPVDAVSWPDDPRLEVARKLLRSGQFEQAEIVAGSVARQKPQVHRAVFFQGLAIHKQKKYGQARPLLEAAMASPQPFPERGHVPHYLGWCCYYLGDMPAAKAAFEKHAAEWPNFDDTHFALGVIALDEDRVDDAARELTRALELQQAQKASRRSIGKTEARLGDVALRRDDVAEAERRFRRAVELFPDHYEAWARLSRVLARQGRTEEADAAMAEHQKAMERVGRAAPAADGGAGPAEAPGAAAPPAAAPPAAGDGR